jgi:4-hydroxy-3-polyprenylbenzoate decarboxylase
MTSCIVAISGASGSIYGIRLVEELLKAVDNVYLCVSHTAFSIIKTETGIDWAGKTDSDSEKKIQKYYSSKKVRYFNEKNLAAPISSGSFLTDGMFVVPCSMKTLSGIACGYANNLTSAIHLENMLKLARLGVKVVPPVPAYYQKPKKINDIVDFVVGKILDSAGIEHNLFKRWK